MNFSQVFKMHAFQSIKGLLVVTCFLWVTPYAKTQMAPHIPQTNLCEKSIDVYYPDLLNDCKTYFMCLNGKMVWGSCPIGTSFDDVTKTCVDARKSTCLEPREPGVTMLLAKNGDAEGSTSNENGLVCTDKPDGSYPEKGSGCTRFFECEAGILKRHMACVPGTVFDSSIQQCVTSTHVSCTEPSTQNTGSQQTEQQVAIIGQKQQRSARPNMLHRLLNKRQIKFGASAFAPGLLRAMGEVLEQMGENMEGHA